MKFCEQQYVFIKWRPLLLKNILLI